jgi:sugar phosphate isomerase/epimerase
MAPRAAICSMTRNTPRDPDLSAEGLPMKLGYNTWSMPTLGFEEAARHCASLGFDSIELTVSEGWTTDVMTISRNEPAEWKRILAEAGLVVTSLTANAPIIVDDERWRKSRERLVKSLELAAELQAPGQAMPISLGAQRPEVDYRGLPPVTSEDRWRDERAMVIDRFGELASLAKGLAARVALEPHVGSVVCTPERAREVKDAVASDAFGVNLDISHFAVQGIPTAKAVDMLGALAIACEVKDQTGVAPDFKFLIPGEGDFDYVDFIRRMAEAGYDGSISVEISVLRQRLPGYDPYDAARQSYEVLSEAFRKAGVERSKTNS